MAFTPTSEIHLCQVDFDVTYKNVRYFANANARDEWLNSRPYQKTFTEYLTVRKVLPSGAAQSSVKVGMNIDEVYAFNYMWYKNANHGNRIFCAFITNFIYINENTTEIVFETDVYQTWMYTSVLRPSFVEREHSETDEIGGNVIPEKFNIQDYKYVNVLSTISGLTDWGFLIGSTDEYNVEESAINSRGRLHCGIYQGLFFYYSNSPNSINDIIANLEEKYGAECIVFIACVPSFIVSGLVGGDSFRVSASSAPQQRTVSLSITDYRSSVYDFTPKNNKLYTSPFCNLTLTNHAGQEGVYNIEEFSNPSNIQLRMYGDVSANPSLCLIPLNYKGVSENYDFGLSIGGFPQCSFNSDTFKLWLTKNQFSLGANALRGTEQILVGGAMAAGVIGGTALAIGTGGVGALAGLAGSAMISSGVNSIIDLIGNVHSASKEPNKVSVGAGQNNLLTSMGKNKFEGYIRSIRNQHAKTIDDFFTMYGYQTNRVKIPNVSSRPCFNYVKTIDVNITGAVPNDDMMKLKSIFNNGVTLWKSGTSVGDYTKDNYPS